MTLRAHSSMAEQPAHNRLGLGSSPGGPTTVTGALRPDRTEGGLIQVRVAPFVAGAMSSARIEGGLIQVRVAPVRGRPGAPVRAQVAPLRIQWEKAWILNC